MEITVESVPEVIFAVIAAFVFFAAVQKVLESRKEGTQAQIHTNVAVANGFAIEYGLSPLGTLAEGLVEITPALTTSYSQTVTNILLIATVFTLLFGLGTMYERKGRIGLLSFGVGLGGGALLAVWPSMGAFWLIVGNMITKFAPVSKW
jgi:hypothetical protein